MNIIKTLTCATTAIFLLAGCSTKPPGCSDEKTTALVASIFIDELAAGIRETSEKLSQITSASVSKVRTVDTDGKNNVVQCEGSLDLLLPASAVAVLEDTTLTQSFKQRFNLKLVEGGRAVVSTDVQYTSRMTDDKKDHLVGLGGYENLVASFVPLNSFKPFRAVSPKPKVDNASKQKTESKTVTGATVLGLECGDLCHLSYKDETGKVASALCGDDKLCPKWVDDPQAFKKVIGSMATLTIGKEFIPDANAMVDSISAITITRAANSQ